ncbi:dihydroflavonol 4-reductase-like [Phalaenopsis equestris]|uniref:dihydroflavonol 4-reductase-like n=1 Tax=Phalaenopsis equestris TaxID=78828 RepID=UPI0009E4614C|nr:dihydroflavonol 4-reductase-like [Phalaenopsis equestris]
MAKPSKVCVTGAACYIGLWLVRKLLHRGYIVHATLRNIGDEAKVQLLKELDAGEERLRLFEADLYDAKKFEFAINGCDYVFLLATPLFHNPNSQYQGTTEASLAALDIIMGACERSESVKRVIYTASIMSASPRKKDDFSFKDCMDESCWTPLHCPFAHAQEFNRNYINSKTLTEKKLLTYNKKNKQRGMKVVSLVCGLVGGDGILQNLSTSMAAIISPLSRQWLPYNVLKLIQEMLGSIPLVHIDDVCEGHILCMENEFISDRYICVSHWLVMQEMVDYYKLKFPNAQVLDEVEGVDARKLPSSTKLLDLGFKYKYNMEQILSGSVEYAKRLGSLPHLIS